MAQLKSNQQNHATTMVYAENFGKGGEVYEYPLNNKEFPARIIFAVIPNIEKGGVAAATSNLVTAGINQGEKLISGEATKSASDDGLPELSPERAKAKSLTEQTTGWLKKQAAFYGSVGEEDAHNGDLDLTTDQVRLYLPRAIAINDAANYDTGFQLGTIGGVAEMALTSGKNVLGAIAGSIAGTAIAETKAFMSGSSMNSGMADILAQKRIAKMGASGQAVAGGMTAASKVTTNPNTKAMFKDVPLRSFSFNFTLIPTTARENHEINNIVKLFRTELYPTTLSAAGKIRVGYKFPNRFKITLKSGIKEKDRIRSIEKTGHFQYGMGVRFLPCYLTSFGAVYNAGSSLVHSDGQFNQVDISLAFTETRALTKADVRDGGY